MVKEVNNTKEPLCSICMDDGMCRNSESHKDYEKNEQWDDPFGYMDCINYQEKKTNTQGQWIKGISRNSKKRRSMKKRILTSQISLSGTNR